MSTKKVIGLAGLLVVLVGVAVWSTRTPSKTEAPSAAPGDEVLPGLDVNAIAEIRIESPGSTVSLAKNEGIWVANSRYGYPADFSKIRTEMRGLAELKVGQAMRGGESLLDEFGLSTNAVVVRLRDGDGNEIAALRLGTNRMSRADAQFGSYPDGQYVRGQEGPVVLVNRNLHGLAPRSVDWIKKELLAVDAASIVKIRVSNPEETYTLTASGEGVFDLEDLNESEELQAASADRLSRALSYLNFQDVADPALSDEELGMDQPAHFEARTRDGFTYALRIGSATDAGRHARLAVSYEPSEPPDRDAAEALVPNPPPPTPDADVAGAQASGTGEEDREAKVLKKLEELVQEHESTVQAAEEKLAQLTRLQEWTFIIASYNADSMTLARSDLAKVKEEPEPVAEGNASGDQGSPPPAPDPPSQTGS